MADGQSLGAPECNYQPSIYLKTVFACINKEVIKPTYRSLTTTTTTTTTTTSTTTTTTTSITTASTNAASTTTESDFQSFDRSYIIASSHNEDDQMLGDNIDKVMLEEDDSNGIVSIAKANDKEELEEQTNFVVGFVSNFFSSYKHISENQAEFFLFVGLAVAMGLALFLAMLIWGMYRSNRADQDQEQAEETGYNDNDL